MRQVKLPTILGLILLVLGVASGVVLVQTRQIFRAAADPSEIPQQVKITDINDKSFVVSWVTEKPTLGFVSYGTSESLGSVANQKPSLSQSSLIHYIVVENLKPATNYFFKVGSGKNTFGKNGQAHQVKTAPTLSSVPQTDIIFGTVNTSSGTPASGVVVYTNLPGATTLSSLTDEGGKWTIPLSTARVTNLSSFAPYNPQTEIIDIMVQGGGSELASAKVPAGAAKPVPPITLGKTHDFTKLAPLPEGGTPKSQINLPEETTASSPALQSGFSLDDLGSPATKSVNIKLLSPGGEEKINTDKPQFTGTGTPGTSFAIKVESEATYSAKVTVDKNGDWLWSPPKNLSPGEHTVTLSWQDEKGQTKTIKRSFTVLAAGQSSIPSFTATPSGSTTSSAKASPSPSPTAKPKASPSPTATPFGRSSLPSTSSGVPVAGSLTPSLGILIMGLVLLLAGFFLPKTRFLN